MIEVRFKKLSCHAREPSKTHVNDAGFDLYASASVSVGLGEFASVPTGIAIELPDPPEGFLYEAQIRPRSSTYKKFEIIIPNSPATIDQDYTGELIVPIFRPVNMFGLASLLNDIMSGPYPSKNVLQMLSSNHTAIKYGDRFAQLVINLIPKVKLVETVEQLKSTERGDKGFGSSGV